MSLSTRLPLDMLLYLLKFLHPRDQCSLIFSGVLKDFESLSQLAVSIPRNYFYRHHITWIHVKLKYSHSSQKIEIGTLICRTYDKITRSVFQNMAKEGYLAHVWQFDIYFEETLIENAFTLEDVFRYCPSLTHLSIQMNILWPYDRPRKNRVGLSTVLKNKPGLASVLKEGFRKLQYVKLSNCLRNMFRNSWPIYQEILTWCEECTELFLFEHDEPLGTFVPGTIPPAGPDLSLVPSDPHFGQKLEKLHFLIKPFDCYGMLKWLLPFCPNLHTLNNNPWRESSSVGVVELLQLKNLTRLAINVIYLCELEKILRLCKHLRYLKVGVVSYIDFEEENLADALQPADNIVDLEFNWLDDNILVSDLLPVFRRWSNLRRLTLQADWLPYYDLDVPSLISLLDFTVSMKSLIYFRIRDDIHLQE